MYILNFIFLIINLSINIISIRAIVAIMLQVIGFLLVAYSGDVGQWMAILGVVLTSFSSGFGEASFLAYSARFNK